MSETAQRSRCALIALALLLYSVSCLCDGHSIPQKFDSVSFHRFAAKFTPLRMTLGGYCTILSNHALREKISLHTPIFVI